MTEVERKKRIYLFLRSFLIVASIVILVGGGIAVGYTVFLIRSSQTSNRHLTTTILDCTTPGGKCYQESKQQTDQAVGSLTQIELKIVIAVKYCGNQLPKTATVTEITNCVQKTIGG